MVLPDEAARRRRNGRQRGASVAPDVFLTRGGSIGRRGRGPSWRPGELEAIGLPVRRSRRRGRSTSNTSTPSPCRYSHSPAPKLPAPSIPTSTCPSSSPSQSASVRYPARSAVTVISPRSCPSSSRATTRCCSLWVSTLTAIIYMASSRPRGSVSVYARTTNDSRATGCTCGGSPLAPGAGRVVSERQGELGL